MSPHARRLVPVATSLLVLCGLSVTAPTAWASAPAITYVPSSAPATSSSRPPVTGAADSLDCDLVRFYVTVNPSMNKPRGDQATPDHRSWATGC